MNKKGWLILAAVLAAIGIFYLSTLRAGHPWGDDFSMYVHHAKNMVEGIPYQDTGYVYDRMFAVIGPRYYPPVYPLALAPIYALFGLNLTPMKVEVVIFFLAFLLVFALSFKRELSPIYLVGAVAIMGFNPAFWELKDDPTSDVLFLLLLYVSFLLIQRVYSPAQTRPPGVGYALLVGVLVALADGTRIVGVLVVPALILLDLWRTRRLRLFPWLVSGVAGLGYLAQTLAIPGPSGYWDQAVFFPRVFPINLHAYFNALVSLWANGYFTSVEITLFIVLFFLATVGAIARLRRGVTIYELYAIPYIALIIIWRANQGVRFLLPLIPIFVLDSLAGLEQIGRLAWRHAQAAQRIAAVGLLLALGLSYGGVYSRTSFGPFTSGVETPASQALFTYIRNAIPAGQVIVFTRPRALALYTGRPSVGYSTLENETFTINYSVALKARYFLVGPGDNYLRLLVKRYPADFSAVYQNSDFSLYRFLLP